MAIAFRARRAAVTVCSAALLAACGARPSLTPHPLTIAPSFADSVRSESVGPGATLHTIVNVAGPWRAYVLDVDLRCHQLTAVKGAATAVGRATTTALLEGIPVADRALAAVNADFFLFAPPGVPTNAHVERGVLISGPDAKPVFWRGADGAVGFDTVTVMGSLVSGDRTVTLSTWNRPAARTSGVVDARWGVALDSTVRKRSWRLDPLRVDDRGATLSVGGRYRVRAAGVGDTLVRGDTLLLHLAPREGALRDGDEVTVRVRLAGRQADARSSRFDAVAGGRPILVTDSAVTRDVETEGNEGFRGLNPRTVMGFDQRGTRAFLAVIDGRQAGYSMGMTLRQSAELMRAVGATRALNLDGGGSSALVVRGWDGAVRTVNKPSDPTGQRPVANAVAVLRRCR